MGILDAIRQNSIGLSLFAIITAGAIAVTQVMTKDAIAHNKAEAQAKALYEIVPKALVDQDLLASPYLLTDTSSIGFEHPVDVYRARKDGEVHTVLMPVIAPDGYTGKIEILVGIRKDGSLAGTRVLAHQETPGLGDKVELKKSPWILTFADQVLGDKDDPSWAVKKDGGRFDQFTGATITPRAIVNATKRAILLFRQHKAAMLNTVPESGQPTALQEANSNG